MILKIHKILPELWIDTKATNTTSYLKPSGNQIKLIR